MTIETQAPEGAPAEDYVLALLVAAGHITQSKVDEAREIAAKVAPEPHGDERAVFEAWYEGKPAQHMPACWNAWVARAALAAPAPKAPVATIEDNSQNWAGMDGTTAWHLIERHADNWTDIGKMMGEWLAANRAAPSPAEGYGIPDGDPWDEHQLDGIFDAIRNDCGPATASRVRAILRAFQAGARPQPEEDRQWNVPGSNHPERLFAEWLNDQRMKSVSEVFHDIVRRYREALDSKAQPKGTTCAMVYTPVWKNGANGLPFQESNFACTACGYVGSHDTHPGCKRAKAPSPAPGAEPLSDEQILMIGRRALDKCTGTDAQHIYIGREVERACAQAPAVAAWKPIETAPKDGTAILAFWKPIGSGVIPSCYGITEFVEGRWRNPEEDDDYYINPTHWMPLPAAPEGNVPVQGSEP